MTQLRRDECGDVFAFRDVSPRRVRIAPVVVPNVPAGIATVVVERRGLADFSQQAAMLSTLGAHQISHTWTRGLPSMHRSDEVGIYLKWGIGIPLPGRSPLPVHSSDGRTRGRRNARATRAHRARHQPRPPEPQPTAATVGQAPPPGQELRGGSRKLRWPGPRNLTGEFIDSDDVTCVGPQFLVDRRHGTDEDEVDILELDQVLNRRLEVPIAGGEEQLPPLPVAVRQRQVEGQADIDSLLLRQFELHARSRWRTGPPPIALGQ